jgi:hypothetical protein
VVAGVEHERAGGAAEVVAGDVRVVVDHAAVGEHAVADLVRAARRPRARVREQHPRVVAPVARSRAGPPHLAVALDAVEEHLHAREHVRARRAVAGRGVEHRGLEAQLIGDRTALGPNLRVPL